MAIKYQKYVLFSLLFEMLGHLSCILIDQPHKSDILMSFNYFLFFFCILYPLNLMLSYINTQHLVRNNAWHQQIFGVTWGHSRPNNMIKTVHFVGYIGLVIHKKKKLS